MNTLRAVLRDGVEVTINTDRRLTHALALHEYNYSPETGTSRTQERLLSWHSSLAEAKAYEALGGETYIVPVETI